MNLLGVAHRRLGLWVTKTEIVFALVEPGGSVVMRGRVPRTAKGREVLLECQPPNLEIVACRTADPIIALASGIGIPCACVRPERVRAVRRAAGIKNAPLEVSAALLTCLAPAKDGIARGWPGANLPLFPPHNWGDRHGNR